MVSFFCSDIRGQDSDEDPAHETQMAKFQVKDMVPNLEYLMSVKVHAVIRLYPLSTKINGSTAPMGIVVIDRNKNYIF